MNIAIVGTGYVGLVTGTCFAETGVDVTCVDVNADKIANLQQGIIPIYEPGLEDMVLRNVKAGRLHFTTSLESCLDNVDIVFSAVGTPPDEDGSADLRYVLEVAKTIGANMKKYTLVVTKSTVPVGTARKVKAAIREELEKRGESIDFDVASNPEFLKEGNAIDDFMSPDRVVVGVESERVIACVMREQVQRQLSLSWGITPLMMSLAHSTDELIEMSTALAKENGYLHNGELAVVTAGVPVGVSGTTNMIKIHMVGNCLATGVGVGPENNDVASGKACVCRTMDEVRAKFKPGMVLVVPSTSNEMLSFVRDAAALVVEEPGLNSHAAIAGKALLKPTVVGAAGATSHIRDGLMVAVDCAHGSVQRLQG